MHIQVGGSVKAIKTLKRKITDLDRSKIEEHGHCFFFCYHDLLLRVQGR